MGIRVITKLPNTERKSKLINKQTDKISQQPENWENSNGPDLVQAFLKKWWIESDTNHKLHRKWNFLSVPFWGIAIC